MDLHRRLLAVRDMLGTDHQTRNQPRARPPEVQWPEGVPGCAKHCTEGPQARLGGRPHPRFVLSRLRLIFRQESVWFGRPLPRRTYQRGQASTR